MNWLVEAISDWIREILIDANMTAFENMFVNVDASVQDVAYQVALTPMGWNVWCKG